MATEIFSITKISVPLAGINQLHPTKNQFTSAKISDPLVGFSVPFQNPSIINYFPKFEKISYHSSISMHPKKLQKIKSTKKAPLLFKDYALLCTLIVPLSFIFNAILLAKNTWPYDNLPNQLITPISITIIAVFIAIFIVNRFIGNTTFTTVNIKSQTSLETIAEKIQSTLKLSSLQIDEKSGLLEAHTRTTAFSWGEKITIIHNGTEILINSRPTGQPATIFKDRLNVMRVRELVEGL